MSKLNVREFKNLLRKISVGYLIPNVSIKFDNGKIISNLISSDNNVMVFSNLENNVIETSDKEVFEFNFSDIVLNLKPYIDILQTEEIDIKIMANKILIKENDKKFSLFFCAKEFTNTFNGTDKSDTFPCFYNNKINILTKFNEIKKIASKFSKVYLTIKDGKLLFETTDKNNSYCNNLSIVIDEVDTKVEFSICFDFKNLASIVSVIENDIEKYSMKCIYLSDKNAGMIVFQNDVENIKYFITSKIE